MLIELVLGQAVGIGAFLAPFALPDLGARENGIGVDRVDADLMRRTFQGEATRQVQLRGLGRAIVRSLGRGSQGLPGPHTHRS